MNRTGLGGPNKPSGKVNSLPGQTGQGFPRFRVRRDGNVKGQGGEGSRRPADRCDVRTVPLKDAH